MNATYSCGNFGRLKIKRQLSGLARHDHLRLNPAEFFDIRVIQIMIPTVESIFVAIFLCYVVLSFVTE
jgi:hypothetical protein